MKKIYSGVIAGDGSYHGWATALYLGDDRLLVGASGNRVAHVCPYGREYLYHSADGGRTWSDPAILSDGPFDDRDTGLARTAKGTILLNYFSSFAACSGDPDKTDPRWADLAGKFTYSELMQGLGNWMMRSDDNGATWSQKYRVPIFSPHGPSVRHDGTLMFVGRESYPTISYGTMAAEETIFTVSRDDGLTWEKISVIQPPEGIPLSNIHEPHQVEAADGSLVVHLRVHIRNNGKTEPKTFQTVSSDDGQSWSKPEFLTEGFTSHLLRLKDGRLLMSAQSRRGDFGIRCRLSADCGKTWGGETSLLSGAANSDLGYPSTIQFEDGSLFTLWYQFDGTTSRLHYCRWELPR